MKVVLFKFYLFIIVIIIKKVVAVVIPDVMDVEVQVATPHQLLFNLQQLVVFLVQTRFWVVWLDFCLFQDLLVLGELLALEVHF